MKFFLIDQANVKTLIPMELMASSLEALSEESSGQLPQHVKTVLIIKDGVGDISTEGHQPFLIRDAFSHKSTRHSLVCINQANSAGHFLSGDKAVHYRTDNVGDISFGDAPVPVRNQAQNHSDAFIAWLAEGRRGLSSDFMAKTLLGFPRDAEYAYPHDAADFRRCYLFLEAVPEAREHLDKMQSTGPEWRELMKNWPELEELYREECELERAQKLYQKIKAILPDTLGLTEKPSFSM